MQDACKKQFGSKKCFFRSEWVLAFGEQKRRGNDIKNWRWKIVLIKFFFRQTFAFHFILLMLLLLSLSLPLIFKYTTGCFFYFGMFDMLLIWSIFEQKSCFWTFFISTFRSYFVKKIWWKNFKNWKFYSGFCKSANF